MTGAKREIGPLKTACYTLKDSGTPFGINCHNSMLPLIHDPTSLSLHNQLTCRMNDFIFQSPESISVYFGQNMKAQLAAKTVFGLAHRHGDILREGWKNILDCMLQLFRAKLLPEILIKVCSVVQKQFYLS